MSNTLESIQSTIRRQMDNGLVGHDQLCSFVAGLTEEAGEVAGVLNKTHFDKMKTKNYNYRETDKSDDDAWCKELGDVLWYLTAVATCRGLSLDVIWEQNQEKLQERHGFR